MLWKVQFLKKNVTINLFPVYHASSFLEIISTLYSYRYVEGQVHNGSNTENKQNKVLKVPAAAKINLHLCLVVTSWYIFFLFFPFFFSSRLWLLRSLAVAIFMSKQWAIKN